MIPSIILIICFGMAAFNIRHIACPGLLHIQEANMDRIRYVHLTVGNSHASAQRVHQLPGTAPICRLGDSALRLQQPVALAVAAAIFSSSYSSTSEAYPFKSDLISESPLTASLAVSSTFVLNLVMWTKPVGDIIYKILIEG